MTEEELKEKWFYVIRTDDWDRYYWEVYANNEMVTIESHENMAYCTLGELAEAESQWKLEEKIQEIYNRN